MIFPKGVRIKLGKELTCIQMGLQPHVAILTEAVYVLHAFHKKAKTGKATPQEELDLAARRYRDLVRERMKS